MGRMPVTALIAMAAMVGGYDLRAPLPKPPNAGPSRGVRAKRKAAREARRRNRGR